MDENVIGTMLVDCAVKLYQDLGPGVLELVYEVTLGPYVDSMLSCCGTQVAVAISYGGQRFDEGFHADLIVEHKVIVELKSVEKMHPAHKRQLLAYLKLTGLKLGYLLNCGESLMKNGITRSINGSTS